MTGSSPSARVRAPGVLFSLVGLVLGLLLLPQESRGHSGGPGLDRPAPTAGGAAACARAKRTALPPPDKSAAGPTANQLRYDARTYLLQLALDPVKGRIVGTTTIRGSVIAGPLDEIHLDLDDDLGVTAVSWPGVADTLDHSHYDGMLRVRLPRPLATGEDFTLQVAYQGAPNRRGFNFDTENSHPMIWTLSAPYGARQWWPCKDYPEDKADSVDLVIRVPKQLVVASNGVLRRQTVEGDTATFWWHEGHPIATYLVSLSANPYEVYSDWYRPAGADSMPIVFYNFSGHMSANIPVQAKVKNMMAAFAARFGEYPFLDEKYGHAEFLFSGGMENQTLTGLGAYDEMVVAHELSHQWWGDLLTCRTYHDVWLNEGFATYCEALWAEANGGFPAYFAEMQTTRYTGSGTVRVPDTVDPNRIYSLELSYDKGSWVLHMLRHVVGDTDFFRILQLYHQRFAYGVVTTDDFRRVAEEVSGLDLGAFFAQWIDGQGCPIYRYDWSAVPAGNEWDITLRLRQVQSGGVFVMPVDIAVLSAQAKQTLRIQNAVRDTTYTLRVQAEPHDLQIDPDQWILRQVLPTLSRPDFTRPCLLVNGMLWSGQVGKEARRAYEARAFLNRTAFDFWDSFDAPEEGYPGTLPPPLGHGVLPDSVVGRYQTVVWLASNSGNDTEVWQDSPMHAYLEAGGNILLLSPWANTLLSEPFRSYLGVTWAGVDTVYDWASSVQGLPDLHPIGQQTNLSWFSTTVGPESQLLYKSVAGHAPEWGIGVLRQPIQGGVYNSQGGRFALISGRPYRWNYDDLRAGLEGILAAFMPQKVDPDLSLTLALAPNPTVDQTILRFALPRAGPARLAVYDLGGRRLRLLRDGPSPAGWNGELWDGLDENGHRLGPGMYFTRLESGGRRSEAKLVIVR